MIQKEQLEKLINIHKYCLLSGHPFQPVLVEAPAEFRVLWNNIFNSFRLLLLEYSHESLIIWLALLFSKKSLGKGNFLFLHILGTARGTI
jgi:hypothetical protein